MGEIVRNMFRRKLRTGLTMFGIVIGVFALTVMGSMSEYFNTLLDNAVKHAGSTINVRAEGGFRAVISEKQIRQIKRIRGVKEVIPYVVDSLESMRGVQMGMPDLVYGVPPELARLDFPTVELAEGRWLQRGDTYHAVVGAKVADKKGLSLGGKIEWHDEEFTVVGIMKETNTFPDQFVIVPLDTARKVLKQPRIIMGVDVVPEDVSEVDELARRIKEEVSGVDVRPPSEAVKEAKQGLLIFNVIMLSGAVLAVVVGGLAVINTMVMSVTERTREIGIKKAVGAEDIDIILEYVTEAALIGLAGGVVGLLLGWGMANFLNKAVAEALGSTELFKVTPRLALGAVLFSFFLGAGAGLYPAWRAARLDPVMALRTE